MKSVTVSAVSPSQHDVDGVPDLTDLELMALHDATAMELGRRRIPLPHYCTDARGVGVPVVELTVVEFKDGN